MSEKALEKYAYHFEVVQLAVKTAEELQDMYAFEVIQKTAQDIKHEVSALADDKNKRSLLANIDNLIDNVTAEIKRIDEAR